MGETAYQLLQIVVHTGWLYYQPSGESSFATRESSVEVSWTICWCVCVGFTPPTQDAIITRMTWHFLFATVTGWGVDPMYVNQLIATKPWLVRWIDRWFKYGLSNGCWDTAHSSFTRDLYRVAWDWRICGERLSPWKVISFQSFRYKKRRTKWHTVQVLMDKSHQTWG